LPVLDDFDRLIEHSDGDTHEINNGIKLVYRNLKSILHDQGLSQIKCVGEQFDPNYHEALLVENDETKPDGVVVEEWRKGYLFKEKLLRPAQVKVNKIKS